MQCPVQSAECEIRNKCTNKCGLKGQPDPELALAHLHTGQSLRLQSVGHLFKLTRMYTGNFGDRPKYTLWCVTCAQEVTEDITSPWPDIVRHGREAAEQTIVISDAALTTLVGGR